MGVCSRTTQRLLEREQSDQRNSTHRPARTPAVDVCPSANAYVFAPGRGDTRGFYAAFVLLSPAFALFVQPRGARPQAPSPTDDARQRAGSRLWPVHAVNVVGGLARPDRKSVV